MGVEEKYDLQDRLINFSADIIDMTTHLKKNFAAKHLAQQLIRSASAAALNYGEAQSAESTRDFIHKMKVCLKELRESQVNLKILDKSGLVLSLDIHNQILMECNELVAIFTASIKTSSKRIK